jgi:hypothetical protein
MSSLGLTLAVLSALRVPGPLSPRNASYRLSARLDPEHKRVDGRATLTWRNLASGPAGELVFHLYMNGFKNEASTFFKESRGQHRRARAAPHGWGAIDVTRLWVNGVDLLSRLQVSDTLATVPLPAPVAAGATARVELEFTTLLPRVFARTGWAEEQFFAVAQWFPKIGVFACDPSCRWHAHQLHLNSEFFADFGVYDAELDVPEGFTVAATGVQVGEEHRAGRTTLRFHAEDVHDFAWFASPRFRLYEDQLTDELGPIRLALYVWPGHEAHAPRHLAAAKVGLAELARRFGPYPYRQVTVVDVPDHAAGAGGMEYPTLFTTFDAPVPAGIHVPELFTMHELSHQYFYGMVASDEVEEAWLDEGFAEAVTDFSLARQFGRASGLYELAGHRLSLSDASRIYYRLGADVDPIAIRSFDYLDLSRYNAASYAKTHLVLRTVEGLLGAARFEAGMRRYFEVARFAHPRRADFVRAFDEGAGRDLTGFWSRVLETADVLDYEVLSVSSERVRPPAGLFDQGGVRREVPSPLADGPYHSEVVVHRKGELAFPVELRVVFEDGSERRERWDDGPGAPPPGSRWKRFSYDGPQEVAWAEVDPDGKVPLDCDRVNNGLRRQSDPAPRRALVGGWQRLLSLVLSAVGF